MPSRVLLTRLPLAGCPAHPPATRHQVYGYCKPYAITGSLPCIRELQEAGYDGEQGVGEVGGGSADWRQWRQWRSGCVCGQGLPATARGRLGSSIGWSVWPAVCPAVLCQGGVALPIARGLEGGGAVAMAAHCARHTVQEKPGRTREPAGSHPAGAGVPELVTTNVLLICCTPV